MHKLNNYILNIFNFSIVIFFILALIGLFNYFYFDSRDYNFLSLVGSALICPFAIVFSNFVKRLSNDFDWSVYWWDIAISDNITNMMIVKITLCILFTLVVPIALYLYIKDKHIKVNRYIYNFIWAIPLATLLIVTGEEIWIIAFGFTYYNMFNFFLSKYSN